MTYSILALDASAGQMGVAVQSHYFGVGALVPWARPAVGVVATQSVVRAAYGPQLLDALENGVDPDAALREATASDPGSAQRQVAVLSPDGSGASHTGSGCIASAGHVAAPGVRAQANLVKGPRVWHDMLDAFQGTRGTLSERLLAALDAAQDAGGDLRGQQAAAIHVVTTSATGDLAADTVLDVRVDDHEDPLTELRRLAVTATALSGLVRMLEHGGLLTGAPAARAEDVAEASDELDRAYAILGPGNVEPLVWKGLLLARHGSVADARYELSRANELSPVVPDLLRSLSGAGMWEGDAERLVALAQPRLAP